MSTVPAPNAHGYTEEDLAMLTEAERAGLLDASITDDYVEDEKADANADPAAGADPETNDDDDQVDEDIIEDDFLEGDSEEEAQAAIDAADAEAAAKAAADPASPAADTAPVADPAKAADDDALASLPAPLPFPNVDAAKQAVTAADKKVADLDTKITDLEAKYDDGELELTEAQYRDQMKALRSEQIAATREAGKLENSVADAEAALNNSLTSWSRQIVPDFLADKPEMFRTPTSIAFKVMDEHVRAEQIKTGIPFDPRHLHKAYAATVKQLQDEGLMPKTAQAPAKAADKPKEAPKRPSPPPTLGAIPASEVEDASGRDPVFANLDKLAIQSPAKFERALGELSDAQRDRYLQDS